MSRNLEEKNHSHDRMSVTQNDNVDNNNDNIKGEDPIKGRNSQRRLVN